MMRKIPLRLLNVLLLFIIAAVFFFAPNLLGSTERMPFSFRMPDINIALPSLGLLVIVIPVLIVAIVLTQLFWLLIVGRSSFEDKFHDWLDSRHFAEAGSAGAQEHTTEPMERLMYVGHKDFWATTAPKLILNWIPRMFGISFTLSIVTILLGWLLTSTIVPGFLMSLLLVFAINSALAFARWAYEYLRKVSRLVLTNLHGWVNDPRFNVVTVLLGTAPLGTSEEIDLASVRSIDMAPDVEDLLKRYGEDDEVINQYKTGSIEETYLSFLMKPPKRLKKLFPNFPSGAAGLVATSKDEVNQIAAILPTMQHGVWLRGVMLKLVDEAEEIRSTVEADINSMSNIKFRDAGKPGYDFQDAYQAEQDARRQYLEHQRRLHPSVTFNPDTVEDPGILVPGRDLSEGFEGEEMRSGGSALRHFEIVEGDLIEEEETDVEYRYIDPF